MNKISSLAISSQVASLASATIYVFKGNNKIARKSGGICSKLTIKTPEVLVVSCKY